MDRERLVQLFFFGFLALMAYELYELMLPFLTPLAWGILLAFMAHPALIEVEKYVKRRSLSTAIISIVVALVVILPAVWASGRLVVEAQALYAQATRDGEYGRRDEAARLGGQHRPRLVDREKNGSARLQAR